MGRSSTLFVLCLLTGATAVAAAPKEPHAVAAELDGEWINLLSEEELEARPDENIEPPPAAALAPAAAPRPAPTRARAQRRRRRGPSYRQERVAGETYRQKYASWSCSAASLTIALDLLRRKPANQTTEELVIRKLGSNISKKDGLTGRGMDALAEVARNDFAAEARRVSSPEDVTKAVEAGQLVVLNVRRPSGSGHYVVVSGQGSRNGTLHVKDPAPDGGDFEWDRNTLKSAIRAGGVAVWKQN